MLKVERENGFGTRKVVKVLDKGQSGTFIVGRTHFELELFPNNLLHIGLLDKGPLVLRYTRRRTIEVLDPKYSWTNTDTEEMLIGPKHIWPWTDRLLVTNNPRVEF